MQVFYATESQLQIDSHFWRFILHSPPLSCDMTSSMINTLPTMGLDLSSTPTMPGSASTTGVWRRRGTVQAIIALSWIVGVSASFLAVGIIGMFAADLPPT